jgi:SH3-like domain-containing protein
MNRFAFLLFFGISAAGAADFRSVQENAAVLYDAPSRAATPLFVVQRNYPLEVIVVLESWIKVRDAAGALTWIERKSLGEKRTLLVTAPVAELRARPEDGAPVLFSVGRNVVLDLVEPAQSGWLRARYIDGTVGFVRATLVWGG